MAFVDLNDIVISQVRSAADIVDFVQQVTPLKLAGQELQRALPVSSREDAVVPRRSRQGTLLLLRLRHRRRCLQVPRAHGALHVPGGGRACGESRRHRVAARRKTTRESDKDDLFEVIDDASEAFHQALEWTPNAADEYLRNRGVGKDIITKYGFGFAPDSWDYILRRLGQKHGEKRLEQVGTRHAAEGKERLLRSLPQPPDDSDSLGDRRAGRLRRTLARRQRAEVPQLPRVGALQQIAAALQPSSQQRRDAALRPRDSRRGLLRRHRHRSRRRAGRHRVDGHFAHRRPGIALRRFTRNVVIAYDGDDAGRAATLRAAQVLLAAGLNVSALDLQGEKDPDSLVQKHGADKFLDVLSHALDIFEFGSANGPATRRNSPDGRSRNASRTSCRCSPRSPIRWFGTKRRSASPTRSVSSSRPSGRACAAKRERHGTAQRQ
jgi:DNA primase